LSSSSSALLARNLFFAYMFGRVVENTESSGALWLAFLMSAVGAF
jgi:membrane associated rhomboid family serine protease